MLYPYVTQHLMRASELIEKSRIEGFSSTNLTEYFEFKKSLDSEIADKNLKFRTEIVDALLTDFSNSDIELIRQLFDEELKCELSTQRHDNLYQLSYYLYELGNLTDVYRIHTAKYDANNKDLKILMDREMLYLNHRIEEVINFVKNDNLKNQPHVVQTLIELKENPDYESEETYHKFINGYFLGNESELRNNNEPKRKWWQIWK